MKLNRRHEDEGFTLVELLIAVLIMTIAVGALVTALSTLSIASSNQRGHAVNETAARAFAENIQSKVSFETKVVGTLAAADDKICIADPINNFLAPLPLYLVVDQEVVEADTTASLATCAAPNVGLHVLRGFGNTTPAKHVGSGVSQLFVCPGISSSTRDVGGFLTPVDGVKAYSPPTGVTATITGITYWNGATKKFDIGDEDGCWAAYETRCADADSSFTEDKNPIDLLPECDAGLERVDIAVTDKNVADGAKGTSCTTGWICTTTEALIRRGGAQ